VIPCYNEEAVLPALFERLKELATLLPGEVSFLLIDDGSRDRTWEMLSYACTLDSRFAALRLSRNFGHQTAVSAGLRYVRGDAVAVIDADLQDPPRVIADMLGQWKEGYDVIYGVRKNRKEKFFLRFAYAAFYRLLKKIAQVDLPLDSGDFSLMDRRVVDLLNSMPEHNRFVRGLRGWLGFRQIAFPYDREARFAGESKYTLWRLVKLAMDGLISFSTVPLRIATWVGLGTSCIGLILLVWTIAARIFLGHAPSGWASLTVIELVFGGVQLVMLGIVGEYVGRIIDEVKGRPIYVIGQHTGWTASAPVPAPVPGPVVVAAPAIAHATLTERYAARPSAELNGNGDTAVILEPVATAVN
jgi:glycosyltransferase involved in cell wall biosynthesis